MIPETLENVTEAKDVIPEQQAARVLAAP